MLSSDPSIHKNKSLFLTSLGFGPKDSEPLMSTISEAEAIQLAFPSLSEKREFKFNPSFVESQCSSERSKQISSGFVHHGLSTWRAGRQDLEIFCKRWHHQLSRHLNRPAGGPQKWSLFLLISSWYKIQEWVGRQNFPTKLHYKHYYR